MRAGRNRPTRRDRPTRCGAAGVASASDTPTIFISYMREDADAARRLCDAIDELGGDVWLDERRLSPGDAWEREILTAFSRTVRLFVPIISANTERDGRRLRFPGVEGGGRSIARAFWVAASSCPWLSTTTTRATRVVTGRCQMHFRRLHFGRAPAGDPDARLLDDADRRNPCHAAPGRGMTHATTTHAARQREPVAGAGVVRGKRARLLLRARP